MSRRIQGGDDHITSLPNEIIGVIFSLLPIKDVVRTSILSKDWKLKWELISDVDIDAREYFCAPSLEKADIFVRFVDRSIVHLSKIKSFHLKTSDCGEYVRRYFKSWIASVLGHDIESLQITTSTHRYEESLFHCILQNCVSLKSVEVVMPFTFKVNDCNCFDNLVTLKLGCVTFVNELSNINTVKFSFPVVRKIVLENCIWPGMKVVEIHAPALRIYESITSYESGDDGYSIKIIGSRLEKLIARNGPSENICLDGSTVNHAFLQCWNNAFEEHGLQIRKLLRELSAVNTMVLDGFLDAIANTEHRLPLQRFTNLEKLRVGDPIDVGGLLELLHVTPYLKFLIINVGEGPYYKYDYDGVENVPYCLVSNLEKIMLDYFDIDDEDETNFELAQFLLRNGVRLKKVSVRGSPYFPTNKIVNELLTFPKASSCLTIEGSTCSAYELL